MIWMSTPPTQPRSTPGLRCPRRTNRAPIQEASRRISHRGNISMFFRRRRLADSTKPPRIPSASTLRAISRNSTWAPTMPVQRPQLQLGPKYLGDRDRQTYAIRRSRVAIFDDPNDLSGRIGRGIADLNSRAEVSGMNSGDLISAHHHQKDGIGPGVALVVGIFREHAQRRRWIYPASGSSRRFRGQEQDGCSLRREGPASVPG